MSELMDMTTGNVKSDDRRLQAVRETLVTIIGAIDVDNDEVDEYDVVGRLLVRAGLMWRCVSPSCRCINHLKSAKCDNCGSRKAKSREVPVPEDMTRLTIEYDREKVRKIERNAKKEAAANKDAEQSA